MEHHRPFFKILREEKGRLYEIPVLIIFVLIFLAGAVPVFQKHGAQGLLYLAFIVILIGAFFGGFAWFYLKVVEPSRILRTWVQYLTGVAVDLLLGGFILGIFDGFFFVVYPDLKFGLVAGIEFGALVLFGLWHSYYQMRKNPPTLPKP